MSRELRAQVSTRNNRFTVKMYRSSTAHDIHPFYIEVVCNSGSFKNYRWNPVKFEDKPIEKAEQWSKEAYELVVLMADALIWAVRLDDWAGSGMGLNMPKHLIPVKIQKLLSSVTLKGE